MSQLGVTSKNVGKKYNVVSTHHRGDEILNQSSSYLNPNTLIISSPVMQSGSIEDAGGERTSRSLFATDNEGTAVRLTYWIRPGNGLIVNYKGSYTNDVMTLELDQDSIVTDYNSTLEVCKPNIIDNNTLTVSVHPNETKTRIGVVTANLDKATAVTYGISKGDELTVSAANGVLSVNTANLDYVDDANNVSGIVRFNPDIVDDYDWRTIEANNGVLRVLTYNLDRATAEQVGVVKPDGVTTSTAPQTGDISVITAGLDHASYSRYGIVKPDNYTSYIYDDKLCVNSRNLDGASTEEFGVIKLDERSLEVNSSGATQVKRYSEIVAILDRYIEDYNMIMAWLVDHENRISALENAAAAEYIYSFTNYGTSITILTEPYLSEDNQVVSNAEQKTIVFSINTNCPFSVTVEIDDISNVTPQIYLQNVRLGNGAIVDASMLQNYNFQSTNMNESTLSLTFNCDNYWSSTPEAFTMTSVTVTVSSINDSSIYKVGSHLFKRWNKKHYEYVEPPVPTETVEYITTVSYAYSGPYMQYYINDDLSGALNQYVGTFSTKYVNEHSNVESERASLANNIRLANSVAQSTTAQGSFSSASNNSALSYYVGFYNTEGEFAVITANYGSKTSHSFMFTTFNVVCQTEQTEKRIYEDGVYAGSTYDFDYSYYIDYLSSPEAANSRFNYRVSVGVNTWERDKMTQFDANNIEGTAFGSWGSETVDHSWFTYVIPTLAANTGRQNIINVGSVVPLTDKDRRAKVTLSLVNNTNSNSNLITDSGLTSFITNNTSNKIFGQTSLTFGFIEDLVESTPSLHTDINLYNNQNDPLTITLTRSADAVIVGDYWGALIYYRLQEVTGHTAVVETTRSSTNTLNENTEEAPMCIEIHCPAEDISYTWHMLDGGDIQHDDNFIVSSTDMRQLVGDSVMDILAQANPNTVNTVNSIVIDHIVPIVHNYEFNAVGKNLSTEVDNPQSYQYDNFGFNTYPDPITHFVHGSWNINPGNTPANNDYSFADAVLTNISIDPWTDFTMDIHFTIRPGTHTRIDTETSIVARKDTYLQEYLADLVFYHGNESFWWGNYYDNMQIESTNWASTGCNVTMHLSNSTSITPTATNTVQVYLYNGTQYQSVYISPDSPIIQETVSGTMPSGRGEDDGKGASGSGGRGASGSGTTSTTVGYSGTNGHTAMENAALNIYEPSIADITGIKFWLAGITTNSTTKPCVMEYSSSTSGLSNKIMMNMNSNTGGTHTVSFVNALYGYVDPNSHLAQQNSAQQEQTEQTSVSALAESLAELQATVNSMSTMNSAEL